MLPRVPIRSRVTPRPFALAGVTINAEKMAQGFDSPETAAHLASVAQAFGGLVENALDQFFRDTGKALAFFGREIFHFGESLAQQHFAVLAETAAKIFDDRAGFERGAPGFEFRDVLGDDGLGARNFGFAGALILLDDLAEVVNVVEIEIVEPGGFRSDVARHAEVNHEHGPSAARGDRAIEHLARQAPGRCWRPR